MNFNTPPPEGIVEWYRPGVAGGGQNDRIFGRLKAKLTGGKDDSGTSYFSFLDKKLSNTDADKIIANMKKDTAGYPMFQTGSTSGEDERLYQQWIVDRYLPKAAFTEGFVDTSVPADAPDEKKEKEVEEDAKEDVDEAEEEVKENIEEAAEIVDEALDDAPIEEAEVPQFEATKPEEPQKKEPEDLSDIVDLLPPKLLEAINQKTGSNYEKTKKERKSTGVTNSTILKSMVSSLEKIQGSLGSIDNELKKQNALLSAALGTTVSNLNEIETSHEGLNAKFDAILGAFQAQTAAAEEALDKAETERDIARAKGQSKTAGTFGFDEIKDDKGGGPGPWGKFLKLFRFLKGGGLQKLIRRIRNPVKTGRALLRLGRAKLTNFVRRIPGGQKVSQGIQRATQFLRGGKGASAAVNTATKKPGLISRATGALSRLPGVSALGRKGAALTAGKLGSRFIPGVQTALGVGIAAERFSKGDIMGGVLAGGGAIPGPIGWAFLAAELGLIPAAEALGNHTRMLKKKSQAQMMVSVGVDPDDLDDDLKEAYRYGEVKSTPEEIKAKEEYTRRVASGEEEAVTPEIKQYTPSFLEKITPGGMFFGKFETGTGNELTKPGPAILHGTEAVVDKDFSPLKMLSPIGGALIGASSNFLSQAGPAAALIAPMFKQVAGSLTNVFDVPTTLAQTNVGGSFAGIDSTLKDAKKKSKDDSEDDDYAPRSDYAGEIKDLENQDKNSPLGMLGGLWKGITSLFGGRNQTPYNGDPNFNMPTDYSNVEFGNTDELRFGLTGTTAMAVGGWSHAHFENQDKSQTALIKDTVPVVKKMASMGLKPETSDGRPFTTTMSDKEIAELIKHGADRHTHSGPKPYAVDINMPGFPLVPVALEDVRNTPSRGEGINALIKGTKTAIFHLSYNTNGYSKGGPVGLKGPEQITVGEEGPEIVMKNLVYEMKPIHDMLSSYNASTTTSELISATKRYAPEILMFDEQEGGMDTQPIVIIEEGDEETAPAPSPQPMPTGGGKKENASQTFMMQRLYAV